MSFTVATYNILATSYIKPAWYPRTPPDLLRPDRRVPALVDHILGLDVDVLCLQEVEREAFSALESRLMHAGYAGTLTMKEGGRPDGCAVFVRTRAADSVRVLPLAFQDGIGGRPASGHVAQIVVLPIEGRVLGVGNTHLRWDPPATPIAEQVGHRQMAQLLRERSRLAPECAGWIVCGDLNASAESDVIAAVRAAGFEHSHAAAASPATCNSNGAAKMIDYLFHDRALRATPRPLADVRHDTPLPGPEEPSDHVAVVATFEWRK